MKDSWLSPKGEIIEVGSFGHNDCAYDILEKEIDFVNLRKYMRENNLQSAMEVLHEKGWVRIKYCTSYMPRVRILGTGVDLTRPMKNTIGPRMNSKQLKVAKELCKKYNTEFHVAINDKRFW